MALFIWQTNKREPCVPISRKIPRGRLCCLLEILKILPVMNLTQLDVVTIQLIKSYWYEIIKNFLIYVDKFWKRLSNLTQVGANHHTFSFVWGQSFKLSLDIWFLNWYKRLNKENFCVTHLFRGIFECILGYTHLCATHSKALNHKLSRDKANYFSKRDFFFLIVCIFCDWKECMEIGAILLIFLYVFYYIIFKKTLIKNNIWIIWFVIITSSNV